MKTIIIDGIEYNLTPKVLFKKGDFVVIQETTYLISKIEGLNVTLSCNGRECLFDIDILKNARLWDITKDAKDGDVLSYVTDEEDLWIMIYWSLYEPYEGNVHYHALLVNDNFSDKGTCCISIDNLKPATKEQRDTLFAKMREAGYEWDSEKLELRKIEQKPAWSEEDESWFKEIELMCLNFSNDTDYREKFFTWLKSFKGRVQPQPKQEWDEDTQQWIDAIIKDYEELYYTDKDHRATTQAIISVLKSIRPQDRWKPSDEQMRALNYVLTLMASSESPKENDYYYYVFKELIEQLKKLREE